MKNMTEFNKHRSPPPERRRTDWVDPSILKPSLSGADARRAVAGRFIPGKSDDRVREKIVSKFGLGGGVRKETVEDAWKKITQREPGLVNRSEQKTEE